MQICPSPAKTPIDGTSTSRPTNAIRQTFHLHGPRLFRSNSSNYWTPKRKKMGGTLYLPYHQSHPSGTRSRLIHRRSNLMLKKFHKQEGTPIRIRNDNRTNFIGAQRELKREAQYFDFDIIQGEMTTRRIDWKFNCPLNPSEGGVWERMVQSVKKILAVTLREEAPRVETLRSILIEAKDGQVRIVDVNTASGNLRRPASKLAVLQVDSESLRGFT